MQNQRATLFFVLAILVGIGAAYTAQRLVRQAPQVVEGSVETRSVVVARTDLTVGSKLSARELASVDWPRKLLPRGTSQRPAILQDRVLRRALAAGEPVLESSLLPEGSEAGLVAVISEERRAVSVEVDATIGVAGFVTPGSRVDVLATLRRVDQGQRLPYSKVILQDVPVLAIDQKMESVENGDPELVNVVTLEVSPRDAEKLIYSSHEGRLQLALRSPEDRQVVETRAVGVADLLSSPRRTRAPRTGVQVLKGTRLTRKAF
jgi:pilus assembly protein CpaB